MELNWSPATSKAAIHHSHPMACSQGDGWPSTAEKSSHTNRNVVSNKYISVKNPSLKPLEEAKTMAPAAAALKIEDTVSVYHQSLAASHKSVRVSDATESDSDRGFKLKPPFQTMISEKGAPNTPQSPMSPSIFAYQEVVISEGRQLTEFPFGKVDATPNDYHPNTTASRPTLPSPAATSSSSNHPTQANTSAFEVTHSVSPLLTDDEIEIFRTLWTRQFPTAFCQPADAVNEWLSRQHEKIIEHWIGRIRDAMDQ